MIASLRKVSKVFMDKGSGRGLVALHGIDLDIHEGEFICLIGSSGCGKSTTLGLLAGFDSPTRGEVLFKGEPVSSPSPSRGVVFQEPSLLPWMNVLQNVAFPLHALEFDRKEALERASHYIDLVGLSDFAHSRPNDLSGGMKQRVAIARTLAMGPDLLLMDEPFGSLDEQTRRRLDEEVLSLWKQEGKTVVFVTHSIDEALLLGTRVVLMSPSPGRIEREWILEDQWPRDLESERMTALRKEMMGSLKVCRCAEKNASRQLMEVI